MAIRNCTNAYMLVYVRDSCIGEEPPSMITTELYHVCVCVCVSVSVCLCVCVCVCVCVNSR